ncbi:BLUF domain-containing protein [Microlunatus flavus]|uniref:Sensors of blue-light using FAD n=1 Tax=Microlunatus flavus TaxID=1036181 RepID=A0A1H9HZI0_9ACTN|nr:BLUF domain-containing protein [Microlunatus flavus]SEQ67585.1 Sensors of blue-light using FAD [Microlunatus flavus]
MVFQLAYGSVASRSLDRDALLALLRQSRSNNTERGVTGMLLCSEGRFFQLLEGSRAEVLDLFATIAEDPRHHAVTTLAERHRLLRQFPSWTMAFRDLVTEPIAEPGYTALFDEALEKAPWAAVALLDRMRPSGPNGWPTVHPNRVLGLP